MTNQFMQDGITYMCNKAYQRGLRHNVLMIVAICTVVSFVSFHAGRTYEYVQNINQAADQIKDFAVVK